MQNTLHFTSPYYDITDKVLNESPKIGYYNLPSQSLDYLARLDRYQQKHVVVIGIGGSSLGSKAIFQFLEDKTDKVLHFLESTDPISIRRNVAKIDLNDCVILVISKSGSTIETISNFKYILSLKPLNGDDYIFITDEGSKLDRLGVAHGVERFYLQEGVGGRFSVLSPVGLIPFYLLGFDVKALLEGAEAIKQRFFEGDLNETMQKKALFYVQNYAKMPMNVLFSYAEELKYFNEWYVQLWAESLGKIQSDTPLSVGLTPICLVGSIDQHSFVQLIVEGPKDKSVTFIKIKSFEEEKLLISDSKLEGFEALDVVNNLPFETLINMQCDSTIEAVQAKGVPTDVIEIEDISERSIGGLIFYFELLTSLAGLYFGINTYDQPGVEDGKIILKEKLSKI